MDETELQNTPARVTRSMIEHPRCQCGVPAMLRYAGKNAKYPGEGYYTCYLAGTDNWRQKCKFFKFRDRE